MRFAAALVFWLITTAALAATIPAGWTQRNIVDPDGYTAMAQQAAADPALQSAVADELTARAMALITSHGGVRYPVDSSQVHDAAVGFTAGPSFPPLFAKANRAAHDWLFTAPRSGQNGDQWVVDLAPMLNDSTIQQLLSTYNVTVPAKLTVPLTVSATSVSQSLHQGELSRLTTWGPWVSMGAAAVTGLFALLTLAVARRRGKALTCLGVSALLVGAAGWAGIEIGGRYIGDALNRTTGNIREIGDVMVGHAEAGLHQWLNLTLVTGAALAILGVLFAILGGVWRKL